ncbi:MAG TPA: hypothetical protein VGA33_09145 [Thermoanaerobaculia bacterium]
MRFLLAVFSTIALTGALERPLAAQCYEVRRDIEYHCRYRALDPGRQDVSFTRLSDNSVRASSLDGSDADAELVLETLAPFGWETMVATFSGDGEYAMVSRLRPSCPRDSTGIDCSFGRITMWIARHRGGEWVHLNLAHYGLGRNSEVHGWATWLHSELAVFNALVREDGAGWVTRQEENTAQAYALRILGDGSLTVAAFARAELWRDDCLTGRLSGQFSPEPGRCFPGQRMSLVRRCYSDPVNPENWAWWNTRTMDTTQSGSCIEGAPILVPVLRTYVVELDAECRPARSFDQMEPAHKPDFGARYRLMGNGPEWGEMLSAISPDGQWLAVAINEIDARQIADACSGFKLNLSDPANRTSGNALRQTHLCRLDASLRCANAPTPMPVQFDPPESLPLPTFVWPFVLTTMERGVFGETLVRGLTRFGIDGKVVPIAFGVDAVGVQAVPRPPTSVVRRRTVVH